MPQSEADLLMRASEDFGLFGRGAKSAMLFLGADEDHPSLHNPDYDFPDDLIPIGVRIFIRTAKQLFGYQMRTSSSFASALVGNRRWL